MTITKERLLKIQHWRETYGADSNVMLPAEEAEELARIVLASLTAEPVFYIEVEGDDWTQAGRIPGSTFDFNNLPDGINKLYATPPSPVADADPVVFTDERNFHHIARGRETSLIWGKQNQEVGDIPLYRHAQPAPVVPEEMPKGLAGQIVSLLAHNIGDKFLAQKIWSACRAAMLLANQRDLSQPVDPQVAEYEQIMLQAGWVMVPKTVTPEISLAINKVGQHCTCGNCSQRVWDMLLAAAPKQEGNNK
ncbi:TPA: hypothetical protein ACITL5_004161 [Salmonella enterica subsp. enterica serovar Virchow]